MIYLENYLNETNSNKNTIDKDSTTDDSSESSISLASPKQLKSNRKNKFNKRKFSDTCYVHNLYEKYGSLIVEELSSKLYFISKIKKVNFSCNKELFEKGKRTKDDEYNEEIGSIPDISFWHQRYYYYSLFDEGIKMDNECIYFFNIYNKIFNKIYKFFYDIYFFL